MIVDKSEIDGVLTVTPGIFEDYRGYYVETYNQHDYQAAGIAVPFVQDDISVSRRGVLRGLHGDAKTWKLISCLSGEIYLAVLDCRDCSPTKGAWQGFTISDRNRMQVLVPPGVANGHAILSERAIFHYKQSEYYDPGSQFTVKWNDPAHGIWWPLSDPILSQRDR
ncbi:dTDP-4-dehydrorhamnose 3,5-epimerase [Magnetospirillum gryphiswaldense MSR-1 v2]|uniref:dTDP-4-dehydrorhamnose 3,5-epimerase n=1 Tax=Magnetospirillum gryphiswaldense (strain DSM 6361 / JCM 21280 / NBRC 15271 / MSR-1) TaxID=431944 RepID=V6F7Q9_MAGGM|nr:dTDP-4-dehydrorhamnose 3,5-epimerase [Magnetospirillum gryphiswaldense]CDL01392.1 dTDP-4-dehydrorhamnose 3,5-epimerase [Magnetospirillum gryphiswaldense MSR-1 v2]